MGCAHDAVLLETMPRYRESCLACGKEIYTSENRPSNRVKCWTCEEYPEEPAEEAGRVICQHCFKLQERR
jgi:hypothetical protein